MPLSHFVPAYLPPPCVFKSILYVCVFISVLPIDVLKLPHVTGDERNVFSGET